MQQETISTEFLKRFDPEAVSSLTKDRTVYYTSKRILDVIIAICTLILLFPLIVLIVLLIKLDSPGPVLFIQKRVGANRWMRDGYSYWRQTTFPCFKFRTMIHNADSSLHEQYIKAYINNNQQEMNSLQGGNQQIRKLVNDPRLTRIGKFLRKTSMDELPQFWNVIRGEMSLVGPRPAIPYELNYFKPWHYRRLQAQPGITGLWQIRARGSTDFDQGVKLDIAYIENQDFWFDMYILIETPFTVLFGKGAA